MVHSMMNSENCFALSFKETNFNMLMYEKRKDEFIRLQIFVCIILIIIHTNIWFVFENKPSDRYLIFPDRETFNLKLRFQ